ncbi:MAG: hypothetical protein P4M02_05210, partial [Clostridia bacterium]|nr:hypothetical protein [Clostridia bacterium]
MKTFLTVLKNNYLRTIPRVVPVIVMTAVTLASIMLAVYITGTQQVKGHIVLVSQSSAASLPKSSKDLEITVLAQKPPRSDLVKQKYDAYITIDAQGNYHMETLRNSDFQKMVLLLLKNPNVNVGGSKSDRGVGVNIIGFMMMF